jgi:hypothetical protein
VDTGIRATLGVSHLARLPYPPLHRLLTRARLVRVPAGSVTHREGDAAELLELVVDGLVRVFVTAPDGRSLTVRYARRGALLGVVTNCGRWAAWSPESRTTPPPSAVVRQASLSTSWATPPPQKSSKTSGSGRDYWTALTPFHTGVYVNFLMEEGNARIQQSYGSEKYGRLTALKSK